jgi:hypothetical protein
MNALRCSRSGNRLSNSFCKAWLSSPETCLRQIRFRNPDDPEASPNSRRFRAESKVAVGAEGAHPEPLRKSQRLAIISLAKLGIELIGVGRDIAELAAVHDADPVRSIPSMSAISNAAVGPELAFTSRASAE